MDPSFLLVDWWIILEHERILLSFVFSFHSKREIIQVSAWGLVMLDLTLFVLVMDLDRLCTLLGGVDMYHLKEGFAHLLILFPESSQIVSPPSSWELEVSYDTIQYLITRLQFDIIAVKVNYLGKVKSTKNSKILNLLINSFYHSN